MVQDRQEQGIPPEADIVAVIEHALLAVRRDQSRRRPPWADGMPYGHGPHGHGSHDDESGQEQGDSSAENTRGARGHGGPRFGGWGGGPHSGPYGPPFGGAPFGDSARGGPGRRGHDGSLGRIARVRMLEALESADRDGSDLSVSTLASAIGVDQPRASRLVQEGVERGLVRRVPDPSDARRALIQLTTAGRAQLEQLRTHRRSAVETALAGFTPDEARTFAELFDRFVRAWPRPSSD
jgi:DNA-binding MarR family transcriptional regulator